MSDFRDFIPEGEDTGAQGHGSLLDFVPAKEPDPVVTTEDVKTSEDVETVEGEGNSKPKKNKAKNDK